MKMLMRAVLRGFWLLLRRKFKLIASCDATEPQGAAATGPPDAQKRRIYEFYVRLNMYKKGRGRRGGENCCLRPAEVVNGHWKQSRETEPRDSKEL